MPSVQERGLAIVNDVLVRARDETLLRTLERVRAEHRSALMSLGLVVQEEARSPRLSRADLASVREAMSVREAEVDAINRFLRAAEELGGLAVELRSPDETEFEVAPDDEPDDESEVSTPPWARRCLVVGIPFAMGAYAAWVVGRSGVGPAFGAAVLALWALSSWVALGVVAMSVESLMGAVARRRRS